MAVTAHRRGRRRGGVHVLALLRRLEHDRVALRDPAGDDGGRGSVLRLHPRLMMQRRLERPARDAFSDDVREQIFIRLAAGRAADLETSRGAFDACLPISAVKAMAFSQTVRMLAFHAIRGSAAARLASLRRAQAY